MAQMALDVYIGGKQAGVLAQDESGLLSFEYRRSYRGVPLSSAMPLSTKPYRNKALLPYLWGLLPEDPVARRRAASQEGVSPNNPFALLSVIGLDCPGAVQFCRRGDDISREERLVRVTETDIADRLALGRHDDGGWIAENEHWSLGGQQSKFALRNRNGEWFSCEGSAATTHIFKSGIRNLAHQALDEYVCMRLAAMCGIDAAKVEYREFEGVRGIEPAIVVERYDRLVGEGGVSRLHQEDFCQALGCLPENKYTMYGGPTCTDILRHLMASGPMAQSNVASFLQMLFFNYLIAATDAHAKNYSLMLSSDGLHKLAPMYDVASIVPYAQTDRWNAKPPKLAMSIGGESRAGRITASNLDKLVQQCELESVGVTADGCARLISLYATAIPQHLAVLFDELEQTEVWVAARELRKCMEPSIAQLCARSQAALGD